MRYLALILAAAAFTLGGFATAQAGCDGHVQTVQSSTKGVVASANGGSSTPVVIPQQPKSGS